MNAIVIGQERPEPVLQEQLGVLGWSADGWCTAIYLQASGSVDPLRVLNLSEDIQRQLTSAGLRGPFIERPDGWTMWLVAGKEPPLASYASIVEQVSAAGRAFSAGALGLRLHAGIGRPYLGLPGLRTSLAEAKEASTIAQAEGGPFGVQHIDDMGIRRILLGWYASEAFSEFAQTLLAPLLKLDNGADLINTLETFLNAQSSATLAAGESGYTATPCCTGSTHPRPAHRRPGRPGRTVGHPTRLPGRPVAAPAGEKHLTAPQDRQGRRSLGGGGR